MSLIRISKSTGCLASIVSASAVLFASGAMAQTQIGSAAIVQNDVRGHTGGEIFRIARGDNVFLDEFVQTSRDSKAKIVFLDTTNMSVGPDSVVKLDQFVYNGNGTAQSVSINATKGAFRFFSGNSEHRAYKVTTPQAVIGVRGTTYDVLVANGQTYIKLQEGAVTACVRTGSACRDVDRPGDYVIVNDNSIEGPFPSNNTNWDFGSLCTGGAVSLCAKTRFASNTPPPPSPSGRGQYQPPAPQNNFAPPSSLPPPVRVTGLPPATGGYTPPVYVPPVYVPPGRPPVVRVDPPVYVPPVYVPPGRPPHTHPPRPRPPEPTKPPRPPQEGKPKPDTQGTPPILRNAGTRGYPGRWTQNPRINPGVNMPPRYGTNSPMRGMQRFSQAPRVKPGMNTGPQNSSRPGQFTGSRMIAGPRLNVGPRMTAGARSSTGPRMAMSGNFGGNRRR